MKKEQKTIILPTGNWIKELEIYPYATMDGAKVKASFEAVDNYKELFINKYGIEHFNRFFKDVNSVAVLEPRGGEPGYDSKMLGLIFDLVVDQYYDEINSNWIQRYMRERTAEILERYAKDGDNILDLGCGPNSEVLGIRKRVKTTEVDVSKAALKMSKEMHGGNKNGIEWVLMEGDGKVSGNFDIIFSSYGYLNLENPNNVADLLDKNLKKGGYFIGSFMNRYGLLDLLLSLLQNRRSYIRERIGGRLTVNYSRYNSLSFPRTPTFFERLGGVKKMYLRGVCIIIPPYNYKRLVNFGNNIGFLSFLDRIIGRIPLLWSGSDYIVFVYQKTGPVRFR
ncbi:MAG: class I SAM-dependent methyltransferase [Thermoplasmata archaeon]